MQLLGFNLSHISAEISENFSNPKVNIDVQLVNVEKHKLDLLKDGEALKVSFKHSLNYEHPQEVNKQNQGQVVFKGMVLLSATKSEAKAILDSWEKQQTPPNEHIVTIYNLILKRCASKAFQLQEDIGLPSHIKTPRLGKQNQP
jgi:hypothetical protein